METHDLSILNAARNEMCFCAGCSHGIVLERLGTAIERLGRRPQDVCIVSDIGCIGMADRYFGCHTFHGLHGRSITYAEGIWRTRPGMLVVVLIGDGGCGIGTAHLVHAARRDAGIKVIVCNNFNFGMTGGQHSPTTPDEADTTTNPFDLERPFDVAQTVGVNGASLAARYSAHDAALTDHFEAALRRPGFVLLDVWELCVAYYVASNKLTPPGLVELSQQLKLPFGIAAQRDLAPTAEPPPVAAAEPDARPVAPVVPRLPWSGRTEICVAGSAGQRIRSALGVFGEIAVAGGLHAAQQDDFPVTVRKGHSLSNLIVASRPIRYTGVDAPDLLVVLSEDGLRRVGDLGRLKSDAMVVAAADLTLSNTPARVRRIDLRSIERRAGKASAALAAVVVGLVAGGSISPDALTTAAEVAIAGRYRDESLGAIRVGLELAAAPEPPQAAAPHMERTPQ